MHKFNFKSLQENQPAQTLSEYALILALIAIVVVGVMTSLGDKLKDIFQSVIDSLSVS